MADIIQMRGDSEDNWKLVNPVLSARELAFTTDTSPIKMKIGDGVNTWNNLNYFAGLNGQNGQNGQNGLNGLSIKLAVVNTDGHLVLTFTDDTSIDCGNVKGANGESSTITVGNVTTGDAGSSVIIKNTGNFTNAILDFTIPKGDKGETGKAGTMKVGTVTTLPPTSPATVVNVGTETDAIFNISIPKGDTGLSGSGTGDMLKSTYDTIGDGVVNKARALTDITADPSTTTAYTLTGSVTQFFSWILKRLEQALGYAWGIALPCSLKSLWEQADIGTLYIPAGGTFSPITRAGRNKTYNKIFIDCHGENPTSLVITLYHNGALIYTSPPVTTDETSATVSLAITGEQKVQAFASNTTGLTKGISVSLKQVNR